MNIRKSIKETLEKVKSQIMALYLIGGVLQKDCDNTQDFIQKHIVIA